MGAKIQGFLRALSIAALLTAAPAAHAQNFDPRPSLAIMIAAFQQCIPTNVFQGLSPPLFQAIYQQTGGSGCYPMIAAAGAVQNLEVKQSRQFPIGPLYVVRVTHASGILADWFIGFNQATGKIEYLNYQSVIGNTSPTIEGGATGGEIPQPPTPKPTPVPSPTPKPSACEKFPRMCPS